MFDLYVMADMYEELEKHQASLHLTTLLASLLHT